MTQQKRDRRTKAQGHRKGAITRRVETEGGASAVTVNEQALQLGLCFGTAENPQGAVGGTVVGLPRTVTRAVPKPRHKEQRATSATMEEVSKRLTYALDNVASNKGAPGPDRQSIDQVRTHWPELEPVLRAALLNGTYEPGNIRRVWIPKANGGQRGLGIPNVVDRVVQEAVRMVLEPLYEPTFHEASHGFRPGRSCQTAIKAAYKYVDEGFEWVVDLDLEKYFDRVNHQRLMARLSQRVDNHALLELIGKMLKAKVVMPDGVVVNTEEGVPQGGPLSPLLSNIVLDQLGGNSCPSRLFWTVDRGVARRLHTTVCALLAPGGRRPARRDMDTNFRLAGLDELDQELGRRGHRFVRYADDCNIYVRSERAGQRVMASVTAFIEKRLRLKVNVDKSAVARPEERHFLGFRLRREPMDGSVEVLLSKRTKERVDSRIRELTPRNWGQSLSKCITRINGYLVGWIGFFGICTAGVKLELEALDAHIRRRLRAILLAHWKTKRTTVRKLIQLGVRRKTAWRYTYAGRQSRWAMSHNSATNTGLRNAYFAKLGLKSVAEQWKQLGKYIGAPEEQLRLSLGIEEVVNRPATGS